MTVSSPEAARERNPFVVLDSARLAVMSRRPSPVAFTTGMGSTTVSTTQAAVLLGVSEQTIRNRIASDDLHGVVMTGGAWRIPVASIRMERPVADEIETAVVEVPPYVRRLIERLDEFDTGMIPCAEAAAIAGVGIKAMRNGLRSGTVPGGRRLGRSWLVSIAEFSNWLGIRTAA